MKKIYLLASAALFSVAAYAQNSEFGNTHVLQTKPINYVASPERMTCPDTAGLVNFTDFQPEFGSVSGQAVIYGYQGGGYVFGNNVSTNNLRIVGQGYLNLNSTPVKVLGALLWFGGKEQDGASSATSKVVVSGFDIQANRSRNTNGSGTFNSTTNNWPGPAATAKCSADLMFVDIDTNNFNYVPFATPSTFLGDFALVMDVTPLAAGDTVGLVSDKIGDAQNLDFTWHKIGTNWYVSDQLFSSPAAPALGSGGLDLDIAMWPVLCDATGVQEFFNGMKLTTFPNPASDKATIEYALQKDSKDVAVVVYDQTGRKVMEKKYDEQAAGSYKVTVEAINLASGMYFYQLKANGSVLTKKLEVIK
jgi:hypothetical protein